MTTDQWVRVLVFMAGTVVLIGCAGEMWYGPRRGMTWGQFLRYLGFAVVIGTIMVAQYTRRSYPVTGYTIAVGIGALIGALGVSPSLKTPIRKPTKENTDAARTRPESLGRPSA